MSELVNRIGGLIKERGLASHVLSMIAVLEMGL